MDGDKKIDEYEFICSLTLFTMTPIDQRINTVFGLFDFDNSQSLSITEFEKLLIAIISTNHTFRDKAQDKEKLELAINDIKKRFFKGSNVFSLADFQLAATQHEMLRKCFKDLGVFGPNEVAETTFGADLAEEFNKYTLADMRDPMYENRKKGVETKTPDELGEDNSEEDAGEDKPWRIIAQKTQKKIEIKGTEGDTPPNVLELEYIYGYRSHDCRNNIFYNSKGDLIYHIAQVGIQLDPISNNMKFITQNQDDIMCIDSHDKYTATGDLGEQPMLSIWDNCTMTPVVNVAIKAFKKGIGQVTFSKDGALIALACLDVERTIIVMDLEKLIKNEKEGRTLITHRSHYP